MRSCLLTEILILSLFAASLHFIMGIGGLVSFGHAAWFGVGAYACALLLTGLAVPMAGGLVAAPLVAAAVALVVRLVLHPALGVYLAMLTLAFAQILWSVAFQSTWTGGDNGILGVWPSAWVGSPARFYYLTLALCVASLLVLWRAVFAPFGYALRAARDSALRAEAIGIDVRRQQWVAFALAGAFAGLAGALHAFHKGSVFPNVLSIPQSIDALVMVLLGGIADVERSGGRRGGLSFPADRDHAQHRVLARDPGRGDPASGGRVSAGDRRLAANVFESAGGR